MTAKAYYNEFDAHAAAWLRELIAAGMIAPGVVDERSICDVRAEDLDGYDQCHFFAGIGGWSHALRLAGWPDDRPVWTGSCPCQSFSSAGKRKGVQDARDLWPHFHRLIRDRRPDAVFGEQVAGAIGHGWIDRVCSDVEEEGYALGFIVLGAHSVGAPHIRQRFYLLADSTGSERRRQRGQESRRDGLNDYGPTCGLADSGQIGRGRGQTKQFSGARDTTIGDETAVDDQRCRTTGRLDNATGQGRQGGYAELLQPGQAEGRLAGGSGGGPCGLADAQRYGGRLDQQGRGPKGGASDGRSGEGFWSRYELIPCRDGKARRVEPGVAPLVAGLPRGVVPVCDPGTPGYANATAEGRVMRLRGYGNAICPPVAAEFIRAYMEVTA